LPGENHPVDFDKLPVQQWRGCAPVNLSSHSSSFLTRLPPFALISRPQHHWLHRSVSGCTASPRNGDNSNPQTDLCPVMIAAVT
jgi:hypothetical protein